MKQRAPEDGALGGEHELERLASRRRLDGAGVACRRRPGGSALVRQEADGAAQQRLQEGCLILNQPQVIVDTEACALSPAALPSGAQGRCMSELTLHASGWAIHSHRSLASTTDVSSSYRNGIAKQFQQEFIPVAAGRAPPLRARPGKAAGESSGSGNWHSNTSITRKRQGSRTWSGGGKSSAAAGAPRKAAGDGSGSWKGDAGSPNGAGQPPKPPAAALGCCTATSRCRWCFVCCLCCCCWLMVWWLQPERGSSLQLRSQTSAYGNSKACCILDRDS